MKSKRVVKTLESYRKLLPVFDYEAGYLVRLTKNPPICLHVRKNDWDEICTDIKKQGETLLFTEHDPNTNYMKDDADELPFIEGYCHLSNLDEIYQTLELEDDREEKHEELLS